MLRTARKIQGFLAQRERQDLDEDEQLCLAVERALEIIGVAASRVSPELRTEHPEISWRRIIALRNVIAHEYGEIILDEIWTIVTNRVPELIAQLEPLIPPAPEEPA
jgi:uncharacterized protein with HEPN domain